MQVRIREEKSNEKFIGLDNKEYNLSEKDLVIADNNKTGLENKKKSIVEDY